jgi:hypothetical protein
LRHLASRRLDTRSQRWIAAAAATTALAALASPASAAPADSASIAVEVRECAGLDASRIRALFALELGRAAERLGDETLSVTCGPSETKLRLESPKMGWIERVLRTSLDREEPERIVALAAAQLALAAWVEAPSSDASARVETSRRAPEALPARGEGSLVTLDVELEAGLRARQVGAWTAGPAAGAAGVAWRGAWGVRVEAGFDRTASTRAIGSVELIVTELQVSPAWRSNGDRAVALELSAGPAIALVHLRGIDAQAAVRTGTVSAVTLDAKARAALRYRGTGFSLGASLDGGYLVSGPEGTITSDTTVVTRGPWVGFSIMAGAAW